MNRLYRGKLLDDQTPLERPRLQLVPPPTPVLDKRESKQASAVTVIVIAFVFAVTGVVMRACGVQ